MAFEKLLDSIAQDDLHSMRVLRPILSGLRDAEGEIVELST
jgi:hypothetical protein